MQRYFADIENNQVFLSELDAHHLLHVMRNKINDQIEVVNNGRLFLCEIKSLNPLIIAINKELCESSELNKNVTLFVALLKSDKNEFVMQKATELGANRIVFVNSKRSIVKLDQESFNKKLARFRLIVKEASEQSHRLNIPTIEGVYDLSKLKKEQLSDLNLLAFEDLHTCSPEINKKELEDASSVSIFIGPEGGFDIEEVKHLNDLGFKSISLGKRILRAETACVYSLSVISYLLESK